MHCRRILYLVSIKLSLVRFLSFYWICLACKTKVRTRSSLMCTNWGRETMYCWSMLVSKARTISAWLLRNRQIFTLFNQPIKNSSKLVLLIISVTLAGSYNKVQIIPCVLLSERNRSNSTVLEVIYTVNFDSENHVRWSDVFLNCEGKMKRFLLKENNIHEFQSNQIFIILLLRK